MLDNADERLAHYREVFENELEKHPGLCRETIAELIDNPASSGTSV